jgi:hypothetical protein
MLRISNKNLEKAAGILGINADKLLNALRSQLKGAISVSGKTEYRVSYKGYVLPLAFSSRQSAYLWAKQNYHGGAREKGWKTLPDERLSKTSWPH